MKRVFVTALAATMLTGCSSLGQSVSGTINGDSVSARTASLIQRSNDQDDTILIVMSAATCEEQAELYDAFDDPSLSALDLVDAWNDTFPAKWWKLYMRFDVADASRSLEGHVAPGYDRNGSSVDGDVKGRFMQYQKAVDEAYLEDNLSSEQRDAYYKRWSSHQGSLTIEEHTPGERMQGEFTTSVVDSGEFNGSNTVGELTIQFSAERCPELDEYLGALGYL